MHIQKILVRGDIIRKILNCTSGINAGDSTKTHIHKKDESKMKDGKKSREEILMDFMGKNHSKKVNGKPQNLLALDQLT